MSTSRDDVHRAGNRGRGWQARQTPFLFTDFQKPLKQKPRARATDRLRGQQTMSHRAVRTSYLFTWHVGLKMREAPPAPASRGEQRHASPLRHAPRDGPRHSSYPASGFPVPYTDPPSPRWTAPALRTAMACLLPCPPSLPPSLPPWPRGRSALETFQPQPRPSLPGLAGGGR